MHARRDFQINACIDVSELSIDQRIDTHPTYARLETTRRRRDAITNFENRFEVIHRADLRPL